MFGRTKKTYKKSNLNHYNIMGTSGNPELKGEDKITDYWGHEDINRCIKLLENTKI